MSVFSIFAPRPQPAPPPPPAPAPSPEPTTTAESGGTTETQSTPTATQPSATQEPAGSGTSGSAQPSEPGVAYQPTPPAEEPVTYTAPSPSSEPEAGTAPSAAVQSAAGPGPAPVSAAIASTPDAAPARFSISGGSAGTITERTAGALAEVRSEVRDAAGAQAQRPDIGELVAAFTNQFAGAERRNLEMLL